MNKENEWANDLIVYNDWSVQNEIAQKVIQLSGINIFEKTRKREVVEMRGLFFYILREKVNMGWTEIARYFEDSGTPINHATVMHSLKNYEIYKSTNKKVQEIEEMIVLKTSMNLKGINRENYLEVKCKELEEEIHRLKNETPLYKLVNQIPKHLEGEALTRIELLIKGWEWKYKDSSTAYAGNKLKEQSLLKVQSKIWEQKRLIKELEDNIEKDNNIEFEIVELQFNNAINQLEIYEHIKKQYRIMTQQEFKETKKYLLDKCQEIMDAKQPEYTQKNIDILNNFKCSAKFIGIEPMEVWAVFFNKHIQAILTHAGDPTMPQAEPIESRYADAINYLLLGFSILQDRPKKTSFQELNK